MSIRSVKKQVQVSKFQSLLRKKISFFYSIIIRCLDPTQVWVVFFYLISKFCVHGGKVCGIIILDHLSYWTG